MLVIIGLLTGGILVAQSMIGTTRVTSFIKDVQQYEVAVTNFRTNYRQYPGDSAFFSPPGAPNGAMTMGDTNGDGSADLLVDCNGTLSNHEPSQVWAHLSQAEMIKGDYPSYSPDVVCGGIHTDVQLYNGAISPYTKVTQEMQDLVLGFNTGNRISLWFEKFNAETNMRLVIYLVPIDTLAVGAKMGIAANDATNKQIGLTTVTGLSPCVDSGYMEVNCDAATAVAGQMYYYLAP